MEDRYEASKLVELEVAYHCRFSRLCLASRSQVGRKRKKEGKQIPCSFPGWWNLMSYISTGSKDQRLTVPFPKPDVINSPTFLCSGVWRRITTWIMTLSTLALQWLLATGGSSCRHREAFKRFLASLESSTQKGLSSLHDSLCYVFLLLMQL